MSPSAPRTLPLGALLSWMLPAACVVLAAAVALPARAQQRAAPFETVEFRLSATRNVNRNFLHAFWRQGEGVEASFETPFYLGFAEVGGTFHRYRVDQPTVPGFNAVLLYAGWGLGLDVAGRLRLEGGGRIGNYRMSFDEATFSGVKNESELALLLHTRVAFRPVGPISLYVSGSYMKVYTLLRLNLWYVSAGLSYRFRSPGWLKEFLQ